jgi:predicted heme/steroid binding protein
MAPTASAWNRTVVPGQSHQKGERENLILPEAKRVNRFYCSILALFALTASIASAQTIEATPIPKPPKPDFSAWKFYVGTWSCEDKSSRRPAPYKWTNTWALDDTGYWLTGKSTYKGAPWFPYPGSTEDLITYDADTGRWIDVTYGSLGAYDLSESKGWAGGKIVWHDLAFAKGKDVATQTDNTITKVSDTKTTLYSGFTTVKGKTVTVNGTCLKQ